jgi:hypothetical protein
VIEKRPYWQEPSIEAQESKLVEEGKVAKFSPLTELPIAFCSWGYDSPLDAAPVFCTYQFSDGTSERFLLSYYRDSPHGQLMLKLTITDPNDEECSNNFTLQKVRADCFVLSHHYSEPEFRHNPDDEDDWEYNAIRAGVETFGASFSSNENFAREDAINNSPFKDLYLKAVASRNTLVGELMFDRTFTKVFQHLTEQLPLYVKSTSYAPSYKTGKTFERYFFLDNPTDREITRGSIYFGPEYDIAKEDIVIFQAGLHNGKNLSFRNQPVARIQSNGEITWQSFENKQIFSLEVRDFLQELMGDKSEVVNRDINEAAMMNGPLFTADVAKQLVESQGSIIYDKNSDQVGDLLIIKAEPEVLATNLVTMLRSNFGLTQQGIQPVTHPNLPDYYSDLDFKFELFADVDPIFTKSFYKALSGTTN